MITIKRETLKAIVRMSKNIADKSHPKLDAVAIDFVDDKLRLRATDGKMFVESLHEFTHDGDELPPLILVSKLRAGLIEMLLKEYKHFNGFNFTLQDGHLKALQYCIGDYGLQNDYPSTDHIKPKQENYDLEIGLNAEMLYKLLKSLDDPRGRKTVKLTFKAKKSDIWQIDKTAAIMVESLNSSLKEYALIMPVRV